MMTIALMLMAASDPSSTLSAVRLEAQDGRPVVRALVSGPVLARVEGQGRDLVLILDGVRAPEGLALPSPVAEVQSLVLEPAPEGVRIRVRLERPLEYRLAQEPGVVSVSIGASAPDPSRRPAGDVRDLYAKLVPPAPPPSEAAPEGAAAPAGTADKLPESDGLHFGLFRVVPSVGLSYVDADTSFLDTPQPVRDRYFQIEPRLACDLGTTTAGSTRLQLLYAPRFRVRTSFEELQHPTHLLNASIEAPIGPSVLVRASHHYANGLLETTEVDPGREYFFDLAPYTRNQTTVGFSIRPGGRFGLEATGMRDSVRVSEDAGFFTHRTDTVAGGLSYEVGSTSRAYVRYEWAHIPPAEDRPLIESRASNLLIGFTGDLLPLVTGEVTFGYSSLSAPQGGPGGQTFNGAVFDVRLRKQFTPAASVTLLGRRGTFPSGFEDNAFYVATGVGMETDLGLPLSLVFHGAVGWQRNGYRVVATGLDVPRMDDILSWSAGIGRALTRWSFLRVDYRRDRRYSNLAAYETDGHILMVQFGFGYLGSSPAGASR